MGFYSRGKAANILQIGTCDFRDTSWAASDAAQRGLIWDLEEGAQLGKIAGQQWEVLVTWTQVWESEYSTFLNIWLRQGETRHKQLSNCCFCTYWPSWLFNSLSSFLLRRGNKISWAASWLTFLISLQFVLTACSLMHLSWHNTPSFLYPTRFLEWVMKHHMIAHEKESPLKRDGVHCQIDVNNHSFLWVEHLS